MTLEALALAGRLAERLLIIAFGGLSLFLGWKLFFTMTSQQAQSAEFSFKQIVVRFQRVAPGIFFAAFGAAILSIGLWKNLTFVQGTPGGAQNNSETTLTYLNTSNHSSDLRKPIQALNYMLQITNMPSGEPISQSDRQIMNKKYHDIMVARNHLAIELFGPNEFNTWAENKDKPNLSPDVRRQVEDVQRIMDDLGDLL